MSVADTRPKVWVSQPLFEDIIARMDACFEVVRTPHDTQYTPAMIAAALRDVDGALVNINEPIGADEIAGAGKLRVVANLGVGYNNLDIAALASAGIVATNTPDVLTEATADFGFALIMAAARRITEAERWLRHGQWQRWAFDIMPGASLHGSTLGILGMGRIGQGIARRAAGFEMRVLYHNRHRLPRDIEQPLRADRVGFDALLQQADHLMVVLPYSTQTHHIIDAAALARMKPTATLVNIARGGVVDELALADALANGRLAAAALDVFEGEPAVRPELLALRNIVLTPHIASSTLATRRAMVSLAVDNLIAALGFGPDAGRPPSVIGAAVKPEP